MKHIICINPVFYYQWIPRIIGFWRYLLSNMVGIWGSQNGSLPWGGNFDLFQKKHNGCSSTSLNSKTGRRNRNKKGKEAKVRTETIWSITQLSSSPLHFCYKGTQVKIDRDQPVAPVLQFVQHLSSEATVKASWYQHFSVGENLGKTSYPLISCKNQQQEDSLI